MLSEWLCSVMHLWHRCKALALQQCFSSHARASQPAARGRPWFMDSIAQVGPCVQMFGRYFVVTSLNAGIWGILNCQIIKMDMSEDDGVWFSEVDISSQLKRAHMRISGTYNELEGA